MSKIKKISDCGENITLMKNMKARLIEISLNVDNYIYKQKPITETQAKAFLDEISSYKFQCGDDIGFLQVIEKLTKYMNIIISNKGNEKTDRAVFKDIEILNSANQSPVIKAPDNIVIVESSIHNKNNTDKPINGQNISASTFNNERPLDIAKVNSKKNCKKLNKTSLRETVNFQEHCITNTFRIPTNIVENCFNVKSDNNLQPQQEIDHLETNAITINKIEKKPVTTNNSKEQNDSKVREGNNNVFLLLRVNNEVNAIKNIPLNAIIERETPDVNSATTLILSSETTPTILYNPQEIKYKSKNSFDTENKSKKMVNKSDKRNILLDKAVGVKVNNKEVKSRGICKALTKTELPTISNSEDENGKTKLTNTRTSNNLHKNTRPKKPSMKKVLKTSTKVDKIKDTRTGKDKKSKRIVVKSTIKKPKNSEALLKVIKLNSNKFNEKVSDDLSWFESIKYVRKIDEQEYFRPLQVIDDKFWCNHALPILDAKDFNI